MSRTVWKHELDVGDAHQVRVPPGSTLLKVGFQEDHLMAWIEQDPIAGVTVDPRNCDILFFQTVGTGWAMAHDSTMRYVDTLFSGPFVWHVYVRHTVVRP